MNRILLATVFVLIALSQAGTIAQGGKPPQLATDITAADVQTVIKAPTGGGDRQMKVVDMGKYNVSVGVLRRGPTKPGAPVSAINHEHVTEVYYVISGSGTLLTGGTVDGAKPLPADGEIVKVAVGPSNQGDVPAGGADTQSRPWRHRHHPAGRLSRLHRRRRSRGIRVGPAGSRSRAAGGIRAPALEEVESSRPHIRRQVDIAAIMRHRRCDSGGRALRDKRPASAQATVDKAWSVPRMPDGKPDMQGVWANNGMTPLERPAVWGNRATMTDAELADLKKRAQKLIDGGDAFFADELILAALEGRDQVLVSRYADRQLRPDVAVRAHLGQPDVAHLRPAGWSYSGARAGSRRTRARTSCRATRPWSRRSRAGPESGHALCPLRHTQYPRRLSELLRHHAGPRRRRAAHRDDPRRAHLPDRRRTSHLFRHPAVPRRLTRPLGRRHAGRRHDQFLECRFPRFDRQPAPDGEVQARRRGHARVPP